MLRKRSARDLVRLALHYAIEEREGFLEAINKSDDENDKAAAARSQALVDGWVELLAKRYSERPMSHRVVPGEAVPLMSVINRPPQEFDASAATLPLKL